MAAKKPRKPESDPEPEHGLSPAENREVKEQTNVTSRVVYQTVRTEGEEEVGRPVASLWWSGLAAGIAISSSVFVQGFLEGFLPDTPWRPLISKFGYCVGFLIVVIARLQLFTENTVTPVLPLLADRTLRSLWLMLRLWAIVFVANLAGTALAA
ncbi:MAG: formate/nitrite transporter family protein, partial [Rhodanobacteraceae bacterium]